jgi:erythromycin esterase
MKRLALAVLITALFLSAVPLNSAAGKDSDLSRAVKAVDDLVAAEYAKNSYGSITVGVVDGPNMIWTKSYGYADVEKKELATKDTVYRIGGMTIKFTAIMLLQLVQAGKIAMSDPVDKYFPEINLIQGRDATPLTFLQLATHTSGLPGEPDDAATYGRGPVATWEKTLIAALPHTKFIFKPGERFLYSNLGYAILGAALSRVAGEPYVSYVEKKIFAPLGMKHSSFEPNAATKPWLAKGYVVKEETVDTTVSEREHEGRGYKVPNGAVYSTVGDMARLLSFELGQGPETVLKRQMVKENYERIVKLNRPSEDMIGYGLSFQVRYCGETMVWGHGGFVAGYIARSDLLPSAGVGLVTLRSAEGGNMHLSTRVLACQSLVQLIAARQKSNADPVKSTQEGNGGNASPDTETGQITKWLTSHAIPLKSVDQKESFADLKPLKQVLKGVRIVGLGEETHGTREFFQLKRRLVEFLVREAGFTVFAMELSNAVSSDINEYVLNGKGDLAKMLAKQGTWAWDTEEVAEVIEWLRQYNSSVPAEKKVRFTGFDIHNNNQAIELVANYLAKVAPDRLEAFNKAVQLFRSDDSGRQHLEYIINVNVADKTQTSATLNELLGFLYLNQTRFAIQTSAAEFAQAFENATILAEFADTYRRPLNTGGSARDLYMAHNVIRRMNEEKPGTRIIVWAHNDHVGKTKGAQGSYLQSVYGPEYYALGFSFNQGSFQAREMAPNVTMGPLKEFTVNAAPEGSVEWYLNSTGIKNFIVDLRNTPKTEVVEQWLNKRQRMRSIGLGFVSDASSFLRINLQQTYDGLVFIESTTRARPNPTGTRDAWIIPDKTKTN